jgi:hypothetical protein
MWHAPNVVRQSTGEGQFVNSQNYAVLATQQGNDKAILNGQDSLFDPVKQDGFTPAGLRGNKRKKKKGFSQSL